MNYDNKSILTKRSKDAEDKLNEQIENEQDEKRRMKMIESQLIYRFSPQF